MEHSLIIGGSGGVGAALTAHLRARGAQVTTVSRRDDGFDLADPGAVRAGLDRLNGPFDRIVLATGALHLPGGAPEKTLRNLQAGDMMGLMAVNAVGPALVLAQAARLLPRDRRAVLAVLSARVGSIGDNRLGGWVSYRASKAALNQILRTAAVELARSHRQAVCVALHPGTVATDLSRAYLGRHEAVSPTRAAENLCRVMDSLDPAQTGGFYDWAGVPVPW